MRRRGLLVIISSPSGGGKSSVIQKVLETRNGHFRYSISATTRRRRPDEEDGRDYHFLDYENFIGKRQNDEFVEWAEVHGDLYATPKARIDVWLEEGCVVFLDVDVDGGLEIKRQYGTDTVLIFIKPPSFESLVRRLKARNTESQTQIDKRLSRFPKETMKSKYYDHIVVNENLIKTAQDILQIVRQELSHA